MSDRPEKVEKIRLSLTLTRVYVDALDHLVEEGLFMEHQTAIRAALRIFFRNHGIEAFRLSEGPPGEDGEEVDLHE